MIINLKIFLIVVCLLLIVYIYSKVLKKDLDFKYAFSLISIILILLLVSIFDKILIPLRDFLGFEVTSNMVFFLGFVFMALQLLSLSIRVNKQNEKIIKLTQELAIIKKDSKNEKNN